MGIVGGSLSTQSVFFFDSEQLRLETAQLQGFSINDL